MRMIIAIDHIAVQSLAGGGIRATTPVRLSIVVTLTGWQGACPLACCPAMTPSTRRLPFLLRGPGEPGSPAFSGTTKALRLPIRASASLIWFASAAHAIPPVSCPPQRSRKVGGPFQARALSMPAARLSGFFVWTRVGSLRSPGVPSRASAPLLDPGRNDGPRHIGHVVAAPALRTAKASGDVRFRGSLTQLRHPLTYASRFVLPLTRKARFRLAGWPLPGGRRTLWTATRGFSSC
jgi:hypothetical protein